ncbi:YwqJ-related putative deaminase [Streptomyces sp. G-G2]|uniref:YwqJ-related putative deaminase n=1 Tax=Streptomyces sp. G-G2 TaxID=3046201 RepID=UPI0024BBA8A9|nr:YwqJ-related putative deaminase [Streptomyces sp. G-G2]MDJ0380590.1 YwqJ-related putative deaminase [Streptomyces sp. G-G2]
MQNTTTRTEPQTDPRTEARTEPPPNDTPDGATTHASGTSGDPRLRWSSAGGPTVPVLRFRRDGILPTIAAALSVRGETLTGTAGKADQPPVLHPLVQDFLDTLTSGQRERFTGRCPEAILLSRHLTTVEDGRSRRASRKPLTPNEARRSLKHAKITASRIREAGDPLHGSYAPPCRSCDALLAHFGVRAVDLTVPATTPATEKA